MTISIAFFGTPTISTTEFSLPNNATLSVAGVPTSPIVQTGIYQVFIDVRANMAAGDRFTFTVYEKINGGASLPVFVATRDGAQSDQIVTPALLLMEGWDVTAIKNAGTDRVIPFSIRRVS